MMLDQPYKNLIGQPSNVNILRGGAASTTTFGDSMEHLVAETLTDPGSNAYVYEVEAMTDSILEGKPPTISLEDSRSNVAIASTAPASFARANRSGISSSLRPGMIGDSEMPVGIPAFAKIAMASKRLRLEGAWGSTLRATSSSEKGMLKYT